MRNISRSQMKLKALLLHRCWAEYLTFVVTNGVKRLVMGHLRACGLLHFQLFYGKRLKKQVLHIQGQVTVPIKNLFMSLRGLLQIKNDLIF